MNKTIRVAGILCFTAFATVLRAGATPIVHTPAKAIASGENPYLSPDGGVWTFSRRTNPNDASSGDVLLTERKTGSDGLVGYACGYLNLTANPSRVAAGDNGAIAPGEVWFRSTAPTFATQYRPVLSFTVPRDGFYSMNATFRLLGNVVDVSVLLDGAVLMQNEGKKGMTVTSKFSKKFLKAGSVLSFVEGPSFEEILTGASLTWSWIGDSVALSLGIVEESPDAFASATCATADFGSSLLAQPSDGTALPTFDDPNGLGKWSVLTHDRLGGYQVPDAGNLTSCICVGGATEAFGGVGPLFRMAASDEIPEIPYVQGYGKTVASDVGIYTFQSCNGDFKPYGWLSPGETVVYPSASKSVSLRFGVSEAGRYLVSVRARDLSRSANYVSGDTYGVTVSIYAGGSLVASGRPYAEGFQPFVFLQTPARYLQANETFDVSIDARGDAQDDPTGLFVNIVKLPSDGWEASSAMKDAVVSLPYKNPVASQGASWSTGFGSTPGASGSFELIRGTERGSYWAGFCRFATGYQISRAYAVTTNVPYCLVEPESRTEQIIGLNEWVYPGEYLIRAEPSVYTALRFAVPADGVYAVDAVCRDVFDNGYTPWYQSGVDCLVMAHDHRAATGLANIDVNATKQQAHLAVGRLYLRKGALIDVAIKSHGRSTWSEQANDITAIRESICTQDVHNVVSFDLIPAGSAAYAGPGRVGYAERAWQTVPLVDQSGNAVTVEGAFDESGEKVRTGFTVNPPDGGALSVAAGSGESPLANGLSSASASVVYSWKVTGLKPHIPYTLYLFGTGDAQFTVAGTTYALNHPWFTSAADHALVDVMADANGVIEGQFSGSASAAGVFCGLQVEGAEFLPPKRGMSVYIK